MKKSIAELNDAFRKGDRTIPGKVVITSGISALPQKDIDAIIKHVQEFSDFNEENDPYGEHDYGSFTYNDEKILWKIDYYDNDLLGHSEDKADPQKTIRVLTILFGYEY